MRTQTKCTIIICCLFIIEIFPLPFTSIISLFTVRKRPDWLPKTVTNLYADKPKEQKLVLEKLVDNDGGLKTRSRCTLVLSVMFIIDLLIPVTIPTALIITRKRPSWFINTVRRLYADESIGRQDWEMAAEEEEETFERQVDTEELEKKLLALERNNLQFARTASRVNE